MTPTSFNPRLDRLRDEQKRLVDLHSDSDFVSVEAVDELPGRPPERYKVTFLCRGIVGIEQSKNPIYADRHEVEIYCDDEFPSNVPRLKWLSPIWHPNIQHQEPKNVCVNKTEWMGSTGLDDLCQQMFEMVQYKNYHAQNVPPYPLDPDAAAWVRDYAEPQGIVDKRRGIFVDDKPFYKVRASSERALRFKIKIIEPVLPPPQGVRVVITGSTPATEPLPLQEDARMHATAAAVLCRNCGVSSSTGAPFCVRCGAKIGEIRRVRIAN